jgi:hypothetical protein
MHRGFLRAHDQRPRQTPFCQFADLPHLGSTAVNWLCTRKGSSARVRHAGGCRWRTRPFPQQVDAQALRTRKGRVRQFARVPAPRAAPRPWSSCAKPPFALDLIVRTPRHIERVLKEGDCFLRELIEKGKVVYEAPHGRVGAKGRRRPGLRATAGGANSLLQRSGVFPLSASGRKGS